MIRAYRQNQYPQRMPLGLTSSTVPPAVDQVHPALTLQRSIGNRAVQRLLLQRAALEVNAPGDIYEEEADRISKQITGTDRPAEGNRRVQAKRAEPGRSEETVAPAIVDEVAQSSGQPLSEGARDFFESRFGHDFSDVRVHTGADAAGAADAVRARAYTIGSDIVFGASQFAPETAEGQRLLTHELVHVMQQTGGGGLKARAARSIQRQVASDVPFESPDFWVHLMTRTMIAYSSWIGDTRQALNQFVTDMGEESSRAPSVTFSAVMEAWLATLETPGHLINALLKSAEALSERAHPEAQHASVAEWSNSENQILQEQSTKAINVDSDLPIYVELRKLRDMETPYTQTKFILDKEWEDKKRISYRSQAEGELEQALAHLPRPEELRKRLAVRWVTSFERGPNTSPTVQIWFATLYSYQELKDHNIYHEDIGLPYIMVGSPPVNKPYIVGIEKPEATLRALKGAYGESTPLHTLPIPFHLQIGAVSDLIEKWDVLKAQPAVTRDVAYVNLIKTENNTWVPAGKIDADNDMDLMKEWLKSGRKPTLGELQAAP